VKKTVLLSYSSLDRDHVERLIADFESAGLEVWDYEVNTPIGDEIIDDHTFKTIIEDIDLFQN
jgi:hypothetical protein